MRSKSSNTRVERPTAADVFPTRYLIAFLIVEPSVIWAGLVAIAIDPLNYLHSAAPASSSGLLFTPASDSCTLDQAWSTPQVRSILNLQLAALAFSAVIEPLVLYVARYKMESVRDAQTVVAGVLLSMSAFDVFHAAASWSIAGSRAVIPSWNVGFSELELYSVINFWVPMAWLGIRCLWFMGVRRAVLKEKED